MDISFLIVFTRMSCGDFGVGLAEGVACQQEGLVDSDAV